MLDIKLLLNWKHSRFGLKKGIDIIVNGVKESEVKRCIEIEGDVKASLAAKPAKYTLKDYQVYLSIGYDA